MSATAQWAARPGVTIEQVAHFPTDPTRTSTITVRMTSAAAAAAAAATFELKVRVPSWLAKSPAALKAARVSVNGETVYEGVPSVAVKGGGAPATTTTATSPLPAAGSYLSLKRAWRDGDSVDVSFPPSLWTAPLNDYHPEQNATVAFMFGPLVLAAIHTQTDLFVPAGKVAEPASFITRNTSRPGLAFDAVGLDGRRLTLIPLAEVMDEQYVVYFYTAGTKPPQPAVHYCPHSANPPPHGAAAAHHHPHHHHQDGAAEGGEDEEAGLVSREGMPAAAPSARLPRAPCRAGEAWRGV